MFDRMTNGLPMEWAFANNPTALLVVAAVLLLFFGGKNIPELMKGLGQGMREFKKGMEEGDEPVRPASPAPPRERTTRE
jgi:sec-independent protein translocase protein TatA